MGNIKSSRRELPEELTLSTQERIELIATIIMEILEDELTSEGKNNAALTN